MDRCFIVRSHNFDRHARGVGSIDEGSEGDGTFACKVPASPQSCPLLLVRVPMIAWAFHFLNAFYIHGRKQEISKNKLENEPNSLKIRAIK